MRTTLCRKTHGSKMTLGPVMAGSLLLLLTISGAIAQLTGPCPEGNVSKIVFPPQTDGGLDVKDSRNGIVLADDFPCTIPGPITDIHIWGSWLGDAPGT